MSVGELRRKILEKRRGLSESEIRSMSSKVAARFVQAVAPGPWKGKRVGLFRALPGEIDVSEVENWFKKAGAETLFPRVVPATNESERFLEFAPAPPLENDWERGVYGVLEPPRTFAACDPEELEIVFVPGVVFDPQGARIGMGKGYYDRFLPEASNALRISLAFDFQLVEKLEQKAWDQPVDWVLTESRDHRISPGLERILK